MYHYLLTLFSAGNNIVMAIKTIFNVSMFSLNLRSGSILQNIVHPSELGSSEISTIQKINTLCMFMIIWTHNLSGPQTLCMLLCEKVKHYFVQYIHCHIKLCLGKITC